MASSSQPAYLPPSVGGPSKQLKEYTKLLIECAQTSLITKFDQYFWKITHSIPIPTNVSASHNSWWQSTTNKSARRPSTSYSSTTRPLATIAPAGGSNAPTARRGTADTTHYLWSQPQTLTTGIAPITIFAMPALWPPTMTNFSTQAHGSAQRHFQKNLTNHYRAFHKAHPTWHRRTRDPQSYRHWTRRTTKRLGNHTIGQVPFHPKRPRHGMDLSSMPGTQTSNVGSDHPLPIHTVTTMKHPNHSTCRRWSRSPPKHGTPAQHTASLSSYNVPEWQFTIKYTRTSPQSQPRCQQQLLTHRDLPTDSLHFTMGRQLSVQHGPTTERTILGRIGTMARSTGRTGIHGGKPHQTIHQQPSLHRPSQTILGCDYTHFVSPFSVPQPTLQDRGSQLTLATHHGTRLTQTRSISLSQLPWDIQTILRNVLQQKHWPTRTGKTMPCGQSPQRPPSQCTLGRRTTAHIRRPRIHIPLLPYGVARERHSTIHRTTQIDHLQPTWRIPTSCWQSILLTRPDSLTHPQDTAVVVHETCSLDSTQHRYHQWPEHTVRNQQVQTQPFTTDMGQPTGQEVLLLRLLSLQVRRNIHNPIPGGYHRPPGIDLHTDLPPGVHQRFEPDSQEAPIHMKPIHQTGTASQPSCMWRRPSPSYEPYHQFKSHSVPPSHLVCEGDSERVNTLPT